MGRYDFDQIVDRRAINASKWNVTEGIIPMSIALRYAAGSENVDVNTMVTGCSGSSCFMNWYVFSKTAGGTRGGPPGASGASGSSAQ